MRSKEVEQSIKVIKKDIKDWKEMLEIEIEFEDGIDEQQVAYLTQQITAYETVLKYISDLEEKVNSIDSQFIHKDKVYEIVDEINKQVDIYNDAVDKFNKLLEE